MSGHPRLLIVDDEPVICQACRRIFSRQGFEVEESTDARKGLSQAAEGDYSAILLDIKMPHMDGIEFLEELRKKKPTVPVMIMTGYPSIPNAASAIRLGAADYITKPFTPEQITSAVQRMLAHHFSEGKIEEPPTHPLVDLKTLRTGGFEFLSESWYQLEEDGSACVGAVVPAARGTSVESLRLPEVGDVVYQGLPLAGATVRGTSYVVPSPLSGVVAGVNDILKDDPKTLLDDPCGAGWIACICTTRVESEMDQCRPRRVILANASAAAAREQTDRLRALGCQVRLVSDGPALAAAARAPWGDVGDVLVFDAASFGGAGPELVGQVNALSPSMKIVVLGSPSQDEASYREHRIFYYAVEPFADDEIVEILHTVFRPFRPRLAPAAGVDGREPSSEPLSGIRITNRNGHKVHLLAAPGLLCRYRGLGARIVQRLTRDAYPVVTTPGKSDVSANNVLKAAAECDRVMVLLTNDVGRLPGSLVRDTKAEYVSGARENAAKVTTLVVQPGAAGSGIADLDDDTTAALAAHIVQEMASY